MPTISIRGNEMPASPIRKLAPLADAAKQRGVHVFHLNIGQPDLPTPQAAIDAIRNIDRKVLEYSPSAGYRSYREKLVGYYEKFNINLTADDIIITTGNILLISRDSYDNRHWGCTRAPCGRCCVSRQSRPEEWAGLAVRYSGEIHGFPAVWQHLPGEPAF